MEGLEQRGLGELGPEQVREVELGVDRFIGEEVRKALFAACANHQVRIRNVAGGKVRPNPRFVDLLGRQLSPTHSLGSFSRGPDNIVASAIAERQRQAHAAAACGLVDQLAQCAASHRRQVLRSTDDAHRNLAFAQLRDLSSREVHKQSHQGGDFGSRTRPVGETEGIQSEKLHAGAAATTHHLAHRFGPLAMSAMSRQPTLHRPPAVAVHDDSHVPRNLLNQLRHDPSAIHLGRPFCTLQRQLPERADLGYIVRMASIRLGELLVVTAIVAAALLPPVAGLLVFGLLAWPHWPRTQHAELAGSHPRCSQPDS